MDAIAIFFCCNILGIVSISLISEYGPKVAKALHLPHFAEVIPFPSKAVKGRRAA